jgi:ATP phosphoribosyltransferase regulatory subunit
MSGSGDTKAGRAALLPAGLEDVLPPEAAQEAAVIEHLIARFSACGYERIKPPLIEFEESLLAGPGAQVADQTFRLMDPISNRMMGLRADMTPQVARIAASRLAAIARPLRLCYAGQILRVRGSQLRAERQFAQVGVELIGSASPRADAEVVLLAAEALTAAGVSGLSVDLASPTLVGALCDDLGLDPARKARLREALDHKDAAGVAAAANADQLPLFLALLRAAGPVEEALAELRGLDLPAGARAPIDQLAGVADLLRARAPELTLTVDPVEHRGFEYQTGLSFAFFARDVRGELGRGGRYTTPGLEDGGETATGFTLYMDTVLRALPAPRPARRLFLPAAIPVQRLRALQAEGWITLAALGEVASAADEARRLGCTHRLEGERIIELED